MAGGISNVKAPCPELTKEAMWGIKEAVDLAQVRERCIKRLAQSVRKSAKCHLSREKIVRYIARIASLSARIAVVNQYG